MEGEEEQKCLCQFIEWLKDQAELFAGLQRPNLSELYKQRAKEFSERLKSTGHKDRARFNAND